jgi:hypothetical protein
MMTGGSMLFLSAMAIQVRPFSVSFVAQWDIINGDIVLLFALPTSF